MNRLEAKKFWRDNVAKWESWAKELADEIVALPDPALRHAVAGVVDTCASGFGEIAVRRTSSNTLKFEGILLDKEVMAALCRGLEAFEVPDTMGTIDNAVQWVKEKCRNASALQIAFCLGALKDTTPLPVGERSRLRCITSDHLMYDFNKQAILGVRLDDGSIYRPSCSLLSESK